jgi:ligand-binding sensor domain-containing protein
MSATCNSPARPDSKKFRLFTCLASFLIFTILPGFLSAQELSFKQYGPKEGLPGTVIYHCIQDKNGLIWFATNRGVSRFDGKNFKTFSKEDGLPDNEIIKLHCDKYNNIWFISFLGVPSVYHNDTIRRIDCIRTFFISENYADDSIHLICRQYRNAGKGEHVMTYYRSVNRSGKWKFEYNSPDPSLVPDHFQYVLRASTPLGTNFYFADENRNIGSMKVRKGSLEKTFSFAKNFYFTSFAINSFAEVTADKKGIIFHTVDSFFYADENGLLRLLSMKELGISQRRTNEINSLFCENDSVLWICTKNNGLIQLTNFRSLNRSIRYFFSGSVCSSILKDKEGGYWVTTLGNGVYYVPNLNFFKIYNNATKTGGNALSVESLDSQRLAAGFADGTLLRVFINVPKNIQLSRLPSYSKNNRIMDIANYPGNNLVIAGDGGVLMLTPENKYRVLESIPGSKGVYVRYDSRIISGHSSQMILINPLKKPRELLYHSRITCVYGKGDDYYYGTLHGAYARINDSLVSFGNTHPVLKGVINHIDMAPDSSLWFSTQEGIIIIKNNIPLIIDRKKGLLSNVCKHILFDENTAWVSTDQGISRIDYQWKNDSLSFLISNIMEGDGLISNEVNQTASAGGFIWAATEEGISYFPKTYHKPVYSLPPVMINRIMAGNTVQPVSDTIHLNQKQKNLVVEVYCLSYRSCRNIYFEYRIPELDTNWHITTDNYVVYSSLPFGQYNLEIRAINKWEQRTAFPKIISIINNPPYWKSGWFSALIYFASILLVTSTLYIINRRRQAKQEQTYLLNQRIRDLEIMALRAQMNPHFIFNCLSSIQHFILEADVINANLYLHKFSALIRKMFQYSNVSETSLAEEIASVELYLELEKMRLKDRMDFTIIKPDDPGLYTIAIPPMIIQPYIENAVNHGVSPLKNKKGFIKVSFERLKGHFHCIIEDNGIGINKSRQDNHPAKGHTSMGNSITVNRIEALNSLQGDEIVLKIIDKSELNGADNGTIVYLSFPITNE